MKSMDNISIYFIQSVICMALFYALYFMFLKNDTFFKSNRLFLVVSLVASLLIPVLDIPFTIESKNLQIESPQNLLDAVVVTSNQFFNSNNLAEVEITAHKAQKFNWMMLFQIVYLGGVIFLMSRLIFNLWKLRCVVFKNHRVRKQGFVLVFMDQPYPPFSFFHYIFLHRDQYQSPHLKAIITHELVHVRQLHTLDLLLLEIVCVIMWCNPLVWLYKSSLQEVHEYLADEQVVNRSIDAIDYKKQILNQFVGGDLFQPANNLGQSSLKKRLTMLGRLKTPRVALLKLVMVLPVAALLISAFAFTVLEKKKINHQVNGGDRGFAFWGQDGLNILDAIPDLQEIISINNNKTSASSKPISHLDYKKEEAKEKTFVIVEHMPRYPGGVKALQKFIGHRIQYPPQALKKNIQGRVFVSFVVDSKGAVVDSKVVRGVDPLLDNEAIRVVNQMPRWKPGMQRGKSVRVSYTVPINFALNDFKCYPITGIPLHSQISPVTFNGAANENLMISSSMQPVFVITEIMPQFPGGAQAMNSYIVHNIQYPSKAIDRGREGRVFVSFVVNPTGKINRARVVRGICPSLDNEALRVVNSMPEWDPGIQRGHKVNVSYTVPIRFALK